MKCKAHKCNNPARYTSGYCGVCDVMENGGRGKRLSDIDDGWALEGSHSRYGYYVMVTREGPVLEEEATLDEFFIEHARLERELIEANKEILRLQEALAGGG